VTQFASDLQAFLEGRTVSAYRGGTGWELRKWISRNKALAGAGAIAIILALTTSTAWAFYLSARNEKLATGRETARAGERVAVAEREQLTEEARQLARELCASDEVLLEELMKSARELPPPFPEHRVLHEAWLRSAFSLVDRTPLHASLEDRLREAGAEAWEVRPVQRLVSALKSFTAEPGGTLPRVAARATLAGEIVESSLTGIDVAARWKTCIEAIAASPKYGGLVLAPQLGLVPLGPDPTSKLFEFAALTSGAVPERDAEGVLKLDAKSAVVLVLLPGGSAWIGAQRSDPDAPNHDPRAESSEAPVHEVHLEPFFIGKYELSSAIWSRVRGGAPSAMDATQLPVEGVSWIDAERTLAGLDLAMPDEAQWEYAARAGSSTPYWWGTEANGALGRASLVIGENAPEHPEAVETLRPNAFGLHHVLGNVAEWCANPPTPYGTGASDPTRQEYRVFRGSSYRETPAEARLADRYMERTTEGKPALGVRPARALR
jgi:formylglycine-generating enzyme required for sulfatase activity